MSEEATSWMISQLCRLCCRPAILQSDGEPSFVAVTTASLLEAPSVEMVLRESPVGEHATNGVAESAMREVKRQTRTLKFTLEAHMGRIVETHSILRCIPMMPPDGISFFREGIIPSRLGWKNLVAEFGESVYDRPPVARAVARGMQPKLYVGRYLGHPARTGSILTMTTEGVVKAAGFRGKYFENR